MIIYIDELQGLLNNAEHKIKLMDSNIHESNNFGKKCREQIDNLLQNESDIKAQLEALKEECTILKSNSNRFGIKSLNCLFYQYYIVYFKFSLVKLENELAGSKKLLADATLRINTLENELKLEKDKLNVETERRKKLQVNKIKFINYL